MRAGEGASWKAGDRVYVTGGDGMYAQYALCGAGACHALPEHVSFAQGAALGVPFATAYRALFQRARARPGQVVLIHGASGAVGIATAQLARGAGMSVLGTASSEHGRAAASEAGCHATFDHTDAAYREAIMAHTSGRGVDVIIEMASHVNLGHDLRLLARGGCVAVVGCRGPLEVNPRDLMAREASVVGVMLGGATPGDSAEIFAALGAGLENGTLRPVVGRTFALHEAPAAHEFVLEQPGGAQGKVVILPFEGAGEGDGAPEAAA